MTSATVVTTTQTQQRLIMPATPLPQIQPNFTNLPPGTVLAPAPGGGNVGYAVVPAQYVTQVSGVGELFHSPLFDIHVFLFIFCHVFCLPAAPAASVCDPLQQPQFPSIHWSPDSGQITTEWVRRDMKTVFNYSLSFICSLKRRRHLH